MIKKTILIVALFAISISYGWTQPEGSTIKEKIDCPILPILRNKDSTVIKVDTDLAYAQTSGRWQWILLRGGWGVYLKPDRSIEMTFDRRGRGVFYENGKYLSSYELKMIRGYQQFNFTINEKGKPFFRHTTGYLRVCDKFLIISENIGDGLEWVFKRTKIE